MGTEFGRRRPAAKTQAAERPRAAATTEDAAQSGASDVILSWLFGPLGGVIVGFLVVCVLASFYISGMRSMGRALDDSWSRKTIGPVESGEPDIERLARGPCEVRSFNPEFRRVQRELGC